jgi:adenylate cyclase
MASIFLSYARSDAAWARQLARALERAGHDVWWDKRIKGGARYSKEIQFALNRADAVLVLWSSASVESAWVQDEAAAGRDSGRLVPVAIEAVEAPLGFRQYQTIDLSRWSGRGAPAELLEAIEAAAPATDESPLPSTSSLFAKPVWQRRPTMIAIASLAALLVLFGAWYFAPKQFLGSAETPTLAVLPFADLSPEGDKAYFSEGVGEAILSLLSREPGIKVIGRSSAAQFRPGEADFREIRRALGVTHFLEGSARTAGEDLRMSVRLIDARDGAQVWAEDYQRRLSNIFAVQDEIGRAVAERLKGTLARAGSAAHQQTTAADVYTLYLAMRAKMRTRDPQQLREALEIARNINEADPNYAAAYAARAELIWLLSTENYGEVPVDVAFDRALPFARRAVELAPGAAEGHAALGLILSHRDTAASIAPLSRAIALDPARAELRLWRASDYNALGRDTEALDDFRRVVDMEPLWGTGQLNLVAVLATAGHHSEAEAVAKRFRERGGSPAWTAWMQAANSFLQGDLSENVRHFLDARRLGLETPHIQEFLSWTFHLLAMNEAAADQISRRQPPFTRLFLSGQRDALLAEIGRTGQKAWDANDADVAVQALASAREWNQLASLYDQRPSSVRICPQQGMHGAVESRRRGPASIEINVAQALLVTGRRAEASWLITCVDRRMTKLATPRVRLSGFEDMLIDFTRAQILALSGRPAEAVRSLHRGADRGWIVLYGGNLRDYPAFDSLPAEEVRKIQAKIDRQLARERAEIRRFCPNCR